MTVIVRRARGVSGWYYAYAVESDGTPLHDAAGNFYSGLAETPEVAKGLVTRALRADRREEKLIRHAQRKEDAR